jgi:hypothetical protein
MSRPPHGQIAALEYHDPPEMDFPDIVEEFDIALQRLSTQVRSLTWDGEDIALIDRETLRIALGWLPPLSENAPQKLVIAVGPKDARRPAPIEAEAYDLLLRRVVERVREYLPFDAVLCGAANQPIASGLMDATFELLASTSGDMPTDRASRARHTTAKTTATRGKAAKTAPPRQGRPLDDVADAQLMLPEASVPIRLTIVTFGVTLFLHAPPIGAALLTYTFLREAAPLAT